MRLRGSVISQLLLAFCVCAVLVGGAAVVGYVAVSHENTATKQLRGQYALLQQDNSALETEFRNAEVAMLSYRVTRQQVFLYDFAPARVEFGEQMAILRRRAPPGIRTLITIEERDAAAWFALIPGIIAGRPGTAADTARVNSALALADGFDAANSATQTRLYDGIGALSEGRKHALTTGLARAGLALAVAVLLVLAASLSTVYTITRPLRGITATVRRLTAGDHAARAPVTGSAEVREVAKSVNAQADESDRLRAQEAESNRLRALAREHGLRIREHLNAADVLRAGQEAIEEILDSDVVYLRLVEGDHFGSVLGRAPAWLLPADVMNEQVAPAMLAKLTGMLAAQASMVTQDMLGADGDQIPPRLRDTLRAAGVASQLVTPFGVGGELMGIIVAQRLRAGRGWTPAEVDAMESVAADLGRGLNHARLYEAENRLVEDLQGLDTAKSTFFATVSHELRAPITTIEGYVEMFGDGEAGEITAQQRQMLEAIDRSTVRLRNLIEDLFTLAKLESGALTTVLRPVAMADVIAGAVAAVRPSVLAGGLTLTIDGDGGELMVDGDAGQLDRVMVNLLSNAVKFTPKGGRIQVCSAADGESAVIRVTDTGIGVPRGDQKELFTRFFRASNATGRSIPGTGLGLAIVRMIVVNHGGDVRLESCEGAGTTVTVRLPLLATVGG